MSGIKEAAHAKVNLCLHVLGRRSDGFHQLESLVAFADFSDELSFQPDQELELEITGDGGSLSGDLSENLIWKIATLFQVVFPEARMGKFELFKQIPVSAGLGGGSADAAAALRCLAKANNLELTPDLIKRAGDAGADIPACLVSKALILTGFGEDVRVVEDFPPLEAVLVNPGSAVSTSDVFATLNLQPGEIAPSEMSLANFKSPAQIIDILANCRNDLEPAAFGIVPQIATVKFALSEQAGCKIARMSGSGATCFGLFADRKSAELAAKNIQALHSDWWVRAAILR